jgi:hypothetical protein
MPSPVIVMLNTKLGKIKTIWMERGKQTSERIPLIINDDSESTQIKSKSNIHPTTEWKLWNINFSKDTQVLKMEGGDGRWYEYRMDSKLSDSDSEAPITLKCFQYTTKGGSIKTPDKWNSPREFQWDWVMDSNTYIVLLNYLILNF